MSVLVVPLASTDSEIQDIDSGESKVFRRSSTFRLSLLILSDFLLQSTNVESISVIECHQVFQIQNNLSNTKGDDEYTTNHS